MKYIGIVFKEESSDYGIVFPDFPGCISAGSSIEDVRKMGTEALIGHIELMKEKKESIPLPSSLDNILNIPEFQKGLAFYVDVPSQKTVRCNVTFQDDVLALIDQLAAEEHLTRSSFLAEAALTYRKSKELIRTNRK
ncbi:MAG: type II toxin-antitoxin system HicB family antitoxin [Proteobacteria bacterium]|nr:type II toxin-antitoxin system HicB family antitoxin [Pseudomonadota bacterium]